MNKKQIIEITKDAILFNIQTNLTKIEDLNQNKIKFISDNLIRLTKDSRTDVYINTKDVKIIEVKK